MYKNYRQLDKQDKEQIIEYYYKFKDRSFGEIANELNFSKRSISRVLRESNIKTRRKNRYVLNEKFFNEIDSEEVAYILGYIYADGFVGDEKYNNVVITSIDKDIIEKISEAIEFSGEIRIGGKGGFENSKDGYILNFSSEIMASDLRRIGLYPNKSLTMEEVPIINGELIRHFIRGYFDGDGTIIQSHNCSYHTLANGEIKKYVYKKYSFEMLGTEKFLLELIRKMNVKYYKILDTKTKEIKRVVCRAKYDLKYIYNFLYKDSNIYMERKYKKWNQILSAFIEDKENEVNCGKDLRALDTNYI
ncbi:MAG: hypothetical protein ACRC28_04375 [Clostridium sp.]|uniref:hypothetical protein n=1 Tax=Clostridium sp. TaxID=1506 RepID=UPI003F34D509